MTITINDLIEKLSKYPQNAIVYIESDHGQQPEQADFISVTTANEQPFYGEDLTWHREEEVTQNMKVRAVLIS